ncbi:hypothetical protein Bpfe_020261 [Biomphalaria pfeifferi]|uniref:Uncharacterized protein n=1 Tax=Biomphalaria pfeifferi TaxID=112525 RepID=A0AAD8B9Z8_BIOPF|nr:hypothetical protein Bpfe_020261 [Biomphalaria pfeifferi]
MSHGIVGYSTDNLNVTTLVLLASHTSYTVRSMDRQDQLRSLNSPDHFKDSMRNFTSQAAGPSWNGTYIPAKRNGKRQCREGDLPSLQQSHQSNSQCRLTPQSSLRFGIRVPLR